MACGEEASLDLLEWLRQVGRRFSTPLSFVRWLLFRGANVVACLTRTTAYVKAAKRRHAVAGAHPSTLHWTHVTIHDRPDFVGVIDGVPVAILGLARCGSRGEREFVEGNDYNDKWTPSGGRRALIGGDFTTFDTAVVRLPASTFEGQVSVVVGVKRHPDTRIDFGLVVDQFLGGDAERPSGDVLLERFGAPELFKEMLPVHAELGGPPKRTETGGYTVSTCPSSPDYAEAIYAAWKPLLPRRLRVGSVGEFAKVVADELRTYVESDAVAPTIKAAEQRLATRAQVMSRLANGGFSVPDVEDR
jgi:hypothetical protein